MSRFVTPLALIISSLFAGCAQHELFASWTIDGVKPVTACEQFDAAEIKFRIEGRESATSDVVATEALANCIDETAKITLPNFARIFVELVDGPTFGSAGPFEFAPATGDAYDGESADKPLEIDIDLDRGRLQAELRVLGQNCDDAGASAFTATLRRSSGPLGQEIVGEPDQAVSCSGGRAVFAPAELVEIGAPYEVIASTTVEGTTYSTPDTGEGFTPTLGLNVITVDLQEQ